MYKKMLVLLDGSKLAEVVFAYAQELSARLNTDLELLHVCNPQEAEQMPMRQAYMNQMAEALHAKAVEMRGKGGGASRGKGARVVGKVVVGYPADEILKYADESGADLIMLSTHGRSGIRMWDMGSVASKVIHAAKVPVWLVPANLREEVIYYKLPKKILLVPLSGSKMSEAVIPYAIDVVRNKADAELVLVNVFRPEMIPTSVSQVKQMEADRKAMKKYLDDHVKSIRAVGLAARAEILTGDPAPAIKAFAKENPPQLIAMATHGHSVLGNMIFGSVTEDMLHIIRTTPMLLVRPPEEKKRRK
jgi:nucleotide-binding universal stress UspA family protein